MLFSNQLSIAALLVLATFTPALASISASCAQESLALVGQRALQDAADRVEVECQPFSTSGAISFNYDECSAKDAFLDACSSAGGKVLYYDVNINCSQDESSVISVQASNVPECVGISCGEAGLATKNDRVFSSLQQQLKGSNFMCSVNGGSTISEPLPPLDAVPTISPNDEVLSTENGDPAGGEEIIVVDVGNPTGSPTRDESDNIISFGSNDSSGASMISSGMFAAGLVSVFFVLA